jgi:hypothetical protein
LAIACRSEISPRIIASLTNLVSIKRVAAVMVSSVIVLCTAPGQQREQKPTCGVHMQWTEKMFPHTLRIDRRAPMGVIEFNSET